MTDWGLCFFDGGTGIAMGHFDEKRSPCLKKTYLYRFKKHIIMVSFLLAIVLLLLGYLLYSKVIERIVEVDPNRPTPAVAHPDGVDYVPLKPWRIYLIQFLKTDLG
jgi:hypothetical protein